MEDKTRAKVFRFSRLIYPNGNTGVKGCLMFK